MKEQEMRILKTGECPSLSGNSTLTYQIGRNEKNEIDICITGNTGSGIFNKEPASLKDIESMLKTNQSITSGSLMTLLEGKSSNTAGFLLAILLHEGLLKISEENSRHYVKVDQKEDQKIIQAYTKKKTGKKRKEVNND